ncbi:MAG: hypothetical protein ABEH59_11980 [Halobacteriales archaeon]
MRERCGNVEGDSTHRRTPVGMLLFISDTRSEVDDKVSEMAAER